MKIRMKCPQCSVFLLLLLQGAGSTSLSNLTKDVYTMSANQAVLLANYCPKGANACEEDPPKKLDVSTIGGAIFVLLVGVAVGTDVTIDSFKLVLSGSKRPFVCGILSQFVFMPLYAFLLTVVFASDMEATAEYSFEASVLGVMIIGCLPGGTTSNLFTWLVGGNVSLSILMSLFSNVAALGMMPLLLYIYYDLRFINTTTKPKIPYTDVVLPLIVILCGIASGMVIRAKGSVELIWWTAKVASIFAIFFLFAAVLIGLAKYPHIFDAGYSLYIVCLTMQPAGYLFGWVSATIAKCSLRNKMTIAFETGVQSFALGLVVAQLSFNSEKEACQFDNRCMSLIDGASVERYQFSWDANGRITEGAGEGKISMQGFLPGQAGSRATGGCCRYNELVFLDAFKFSALCSLMYSLHALWMILYFRKLFPNGRAKLREKIVEQEFKEYSRPKVINADQEYQPVFGTSGVASAAVNPATTLLELLDKAAATNGKELALCVEDLGGVDCPKENKMKATVSPPLSAWRKWTWNEYKRDIDAAARGFAHLGVDMFGSVAIFGFNSPEWTISAIGAMVCGAKACGIYPTDTLEQVAYKTAHSGAAVAVVEDLKKMQRFKEKATQLPKLKAIIVYGATPDVTTISRGDGGPDIKVYSWQQFIDLGRESGEAYEPGSKAIAERRPQIKPGHACCLVYTSGTTGMPKAVMLSHDNVISMSNGTVHAMRNSMGVEYEQERGLSYLPLSHVAGFQLDIIVPVVMTANTNGFFTTFFARPYDMKEGTLKNRLTFVRPTIFLGVPRVWEKFSEALKEVGRKTAAMTGMRARMPIFCCFRKSSAAAWAKRQGLRSLRELQYNRSGRTTCLFGMADAMVLSKVRAALGLDACKLCVTGAAPVALETLEYFGSLGISLNEVYGMSECAAATTFSTDEMHIWGSCGAPGPGTQVKVFIVNDKDLNQKTECPRAQDMFNPTEAEQGEICFRGRHVMMGYLANPDMGAQHMAEIEKKTAETIDDDGWLHSGDKGCIGQEGMLRITGRYKELIITAGGENVAPVPFEDHIKQACGAISNAMMVGDKRKFNTCLITLKAEGATGELPGTDQLNGDAKNLVPGIATISEAMKSPEYRKKIEDAIKSANGNSIVCPSNASKVQKFEILPLDFSSETGEFTPTLKLKRKFVEEKYLAVIDSMYTGGD